MNNINLRKRASRQDKQFQHGVAELLEPEIVEWLEKLEHHGAIVWNAASHRCGTLP